MLIVLEFVIFDVLQIIFRGSSTEQSLETEYKPLRSFKGSLNICIASMCFSVVSQSKESRPSSVLARVRFLDFSYGFILISDRMATMKLSGRGRFRSVINRHISQLSIYSNLPSGYCFWCIFDAIWLHRFARLSYWYPVITAAKKIQILLYFEELWKNPSTQVYLRNSTLR